MAPRKEKSPARSSSAPPTKDRFPISTEMASAHKPILVLTPPSPTHTSFPSSSASSSNKFKSLPHSSNLSFRNRRPKLLLFVSAFAIAGLFCFWAAIPGTQQIEIPDALVTEDVADNADFDPWLTLRERLDTRPDFQVTLEPPAEPWPEKPEMYEPEHVETEPVPELETAPTEQSEAFAQPEEELVQGGDPIEHEELSDIETPVEPVAPVDPVAPEEPVAPEIIADKEFIERLQGISFIDIYPEDSEETEAQPEAEVEAEATPETS